MEKASEVDDVGWVWWGLKRLTDEQASERLQGFTADEKARARVMYLDNNKLTVLPIELLELGSLKELWLENNCISSLPSFLGQLTTLKGLLLDDNQLATLPASMTNLQQLQAYVNPRFSCFFSAHSLALLGWTSGATSSCHSIFKSSPTTASPLRLFSRRLQRLPRSATKRRGPRP